MDNNQIIKAIKDLIDSRIPGAHVRVDCLAIGDIDWCSLDHRARRVGLRLEPTHDGVRLERAHLA